MRHCSRLTTFFLMSASVPRRELARQGVSDRAAVEGAHFWCPGLRAQLWSSLGNPLVVTRRRSAADSRVRFGSALCLPALGSVQMGDATPTSLLACLDERCAASPARQLFTWLDDRGEQQDSLSIR